MSSIDHPAANHADHFRATLQNKHYSLRPSNPHQPRCIEKIMILITISPKVGCCRARYLFAGLNASSGNDIGLPWAVARRCRFSLHFLHAFHFSIYPDLCWGSHSGQRPSMPVIPDYQERSLRWVYGVA